MKEVIGNFIFDSNFDNGNLHKAIEVEEFQPLVNDSKIMKKYEFQDIINSLKGMKIRTLPSQDNLDFPKKENCSKTDIIFVKRYCLWTKPDAYDSGANIKNRSWFYFSIREISSIIPENTCNLNEEDEGKKDSLIKVLNISTSSINSNREVLQQKQKGILI